MSIYEYNEEYVKRTLLEDGMKAGYDKGKAEGKAETLVKGVEAVMKNFHISLEEACAGLGITAGEYERAKDDICRS